MNKFTIIFWNIWLDNQLDGPTGPRSRELLKELDALVAAHTPDCIGINEVLFESPDQVPFVFEHLKHHGYRYTHFAYASPINNQWEIGAGFVSKYPLKDIEDIVLGEDVFARIERGISGYKVRSLGVRVELSNKQSVQVILAHPHALKPRSLREHWRHQKVLLETVRKPRYKQVIMGGDFNEPNSLPFNFTRRTKDIFYHRSGTLMDATWHLKPDHASPIGLNLDKLFWTKEPTTKLLEFKVLKTAVSDHRPLLGKFEFNNIV